MSNAIGIKVTKATGDYDLGASKFFGAPTLPKEWTNIFSDDEIFFCQIKCEDIAEFDTENRLPHSGYIYVFLDVESYPYTPRVLYFNGTPDTVLDGFNDEIDKAGNITEEWLMHFNTANEAADGIKMLGTPADWNYSEEPPKVFLQYDPLESEMGFRDSVDGYIYLLFGEQSDRLEDIIYTEERS